MSSFEPEPFKGSWGSDVGSDATPCQTPCESDVEADGSASLSISVKYEILIQEHQKLKKKYQKLKKAFKAINSQVSGLELDTDDEEEVGEEVLQSIQEEVKSNSISFSAVVKSKLTNLVNGSNSPSGE